MSANYQALLSTILPLGTSMTNFASFISMRSAEALRLYGNTYQKLQIFIRNQHPFSFIQKQT